MRTKYDVGDKIVVEGTVDSIHIDQEDGLIYIIRFGSSAGPLNDPKLMFEENAIKDKWIPTESTETPFKEE